MKLLVSILLALSTINCSLAQYAWKLEFFGGDYVGATQVETDFNDDIYVGGYYFNGATILNQSFSGNGAFLLKLDKNGKSIRMKSFESNSGFCVILGVKVDAYGNAYINGQYQNDIQGDFSYSGAGYHSFLAKYDKNGILLWSKNYPELQWFQTFDVNSEGYYALCSFGKIEVGKPDGSVLFTKTLGAQTEAISTIIDDNHKTYFFGKFNGTLSLNAYQVTGTNGFDIFYASLDESGNCSWLKSASRNVPSWMQTGGLGQTSDFGGGEIYGNDLYFTGFIWKDYKMEGNIVIGDAVADFPGVFITKLDLNGNLSFIKKIHDNAAGLRSVRLRVKSTIFSYGQINEFPSIDLINSLGSIGSNVSLPFKVDESGGFAIDSKDSIYISGRFQEYVLPDFHSVFKGFILKIGSPSLPPDPPAAPEIEAVNTLCVNQGQFTISASTVADATGYQWEIMIGNTVITKNTPVSSIAIQFDELNITHDFQIRVKVATPAGTSEYSGYTTVKVDQPFEPSILKLDCKELSTSATDFVWVKDDVIYDAFPANHSPANIVEPGLYYIKQDNACGVVTSNKIEFKKDNFFIPNVITPDNGDTLNQTFQLDAQLKSSKISIYDRWGKLVYNSNNYLNDWNAPGINQGIYYVNISNSCNMFDYKGTLTVLR